MNPVGTAGRTLTCKCCRSFRHLIAKCPDTWENQAKVNVTEDEHAVLFTGYNKDEIASWVWTRVTVLFWSEHVVVLFAEKSGLMGI